MMVKAKGVPVAISTIYYWIHHGQLGVNKANLLYPRKERTKKKQFSSNFKPVGQSIDQDQRALISVTISVILRLIRLFRHELKTSAY